MKKMFILFILLSLHSSIVAEASDHIIDENELREYLVTIFSADHSGEYGFDSEEMENITFAKPIPIYSLNSSFAFGKSNYMLKEEVEEWIAVIYEQGQPINGLKLREYNEGQLSVSGFGYPLTLAADVVQLGEDELLFYEFPTGYYYAFNQEEDRIRLLEEEVIVNQPEDAQLDDLSKEAFQEVLEKRYKEYENTSGDDTLSSGLGSSESAQENSFFLYSSIGLGVVGVSMFSLFLWRKERGHK